MADKLTDEQVAVLARVGATEEGYAVHVFRDYEDDYDEEPVQCDDVRALALEVQQSRARRCGNCRHWTDSFVTGGAYGWCDQGRTAGTETAASWSCADFTPQEGR